MGVKQGVKVVFGNATAFTDANGQVLFSDILPATGINYSINMNGYNSVTGMLDVTDQVVVKDIVLKSVIGTSSSTDGQSSGGSGGSSHGGSSREELDENTDEGTTNNPTDINGPSDKNIKNFNDINTHWAKESIEYLANKGIINGTSENTFSPSSKITRADFIVILVKALDLKGSSNESFNDVREEDYFYSAVSIAKELGIASGTGSGNFNLRDNLTRQDMAVLIMRALNKSNIDFQTDQENVTKYDDSIEVANYAKDSINKLIAQNIISGYNNKLMPKEKSTRAQVATIIYRIMKEVLKK
jgi:hypothetical protein